MVIMGVRVKMGDFPPLLDSSGTPLHLVHGFWSMAIQYNSVNEDDMWKGFVNLLNLKENSQLDTIYPPILVDARNGFSHLKTKNHVHQL